MSTCSININGQTNDVLYQLTHSYMIYASSALSGLSAVHLICGAIFGFVAQPMYTKLGIHLAGTVLAILSELSFLSITSSLTA